MDDRVRGLDKRRLRECPSAGEETRDQPTERAVIEEFKAAGLPLKRVEYYTAETDPNSLLGRPGQYIGKANFLDADAMEAHYKDAFDLFQGAPGARKSARKFVQKEAQKMDVSYGGSVEVFDNEESARKRYEYGKSIAESGGLFAEYDYLAGLILVRLSHKLTPDQAGEYEQVLKDL